MFWSWQKGRQDADYDKFVICCFKRFDSYIIKYPENCFLPPHKDEADSGKHYRLNLVFKGKGKFICEKVIFQTKRIILFRPDLYEHSMKNDNSVRLVFSVGIVL